MADCLFCKIIDRKIPSSIVYEDDRVLAFNDIDPQAPLHVLVVPRAHAPNAAATAAADGGDAAALLAAADAVARAEGYDSYRLVFNTGADAHQTVFHTHLHVLAGRPMTWPPG